MLIPSARREPSAAALARAAEEELYAESERSGRALVSIHVQVTHPELDSRFEVLQAQIADAQVVDAEAEEVAPAEPDPEQVAPMLALAADEAPQPTAAFELTPQLSTNAFAGYEAGRAFGAYSAQRAFVGGSAQSTGATRLLDVRA